MYFLQFGYSVRFLESLIRLTQAHARLIDRKSAELDDAVAVLRVMECSAYAYGGFDGNVPDLDGVFYCDPFDLDLPVYGSPDDDFLVFQYNILRRYDMLKCMSNGATRKALAFINGTGGNANQAWRNFDTPRDVQTSTESRDHYGRSFTQTDTRTPGPKRKRM